MPDFTKNTPSHPLLSRPINVYSIPPELLDLLTVRSVTNTGALQVISSAEGQDPTAVDEESGENHTKRTGEEEAVIVEPGSSSSLTCQTCLSTTFPTLEEQRAHFKSDWHRYNVRVSINHKGSLKGSLQGKGKVPRGVLTEEEFEEVDDGTCFEACGFFFLWKRTVGWGADFWSRSLLHHLSDLASHQCSLTLL
jgi:hypothetical protein